MFRGLLLLAGILVGCLTLSNMGQARDLRLTPNNVYSIWININKCLDKIDPITFSSAPPATLQTFQGKRPADVLEQVKRFHTNLFELIATEGSSHAIEIYQPKEEVTPRIVYINSGNLQDALVEYYFTTSGRNDLISQYYIRHDYTDKIPSDVYGLVDLANQKLDLILASRGLK